MQSQDSSDESEVDVDSNTTQRDKQDTNKGCVLVENENEESNEVHAKKVDWDNREGEKSNEKDKCVSEEEGESEDNSDEEVESQDSLDGKEHVDPESAEGNDECVSDVIHAECMDDGRDNGKKTVKGRNHMMKRN